MARATAAAKPKAGRPAAGKAPPRKRVAAKAAPARPGQSFTVSHYRETDFKDDGLRAYAKYRDLGISEATHGLARAHVIRLVPPCRPEEVSKRHYHDVDFQMVYVLKGWIKNEFEGHGEQIMRAGTCWLQPPRIRHTVLDYSDDCELLEVILPADFATVALE